MPAGGGEDREMASRADSKTRREKTRASGCLASALPLRSSRRWPRRPQRLQGATGLSKTDIVNRSISLYDFLQTQIDAGNDIIIRDRTTGETQIVKFL